MTSFKHYHRTSDLRSKPYQLFSSLYDFVAYVYITYININAEVNSYYNI